MTVPSAPGWPDLRLTAGFLTDDDFFADFLMDLAFNAFLAAGLVFDFLAIFFLARFIRFSLTSGLTASQHV
jgi:hypothetical protein